MQKVPGPLDVSNSKFKFEFAPNNTFTFTSHWFWVQELALEKQATSTNRLPPIGICPENLIKHIQKFIIHWGRLFLSIFLNVPKNRFLIRVAERTIVRTNILFVRLVIYRTNIILNILRFFRRNCVKILKLSKNLSKFLKKFIKIFNFKKYFKIFRNCLKF